LSQHSVKKPIRLPDSKDKIGKNKEKGEVIPYGKNCEGWFGSRGCPIAHGDALHLAQYG
jgi:hypothetical protein